MGLRAGAACLVVSGRVAATRLLGKHARFVVLRVARCSAGALPTALSAPAPPQQQQQQREGQRQEQEQEQEQRLQEQEQEQEQQEQEQEQQQDPPPPLPAAGEVRAGAEVALRLVSGCWFVGEAFPGHRQDCKVGDVVEAVVYAVDRGGGACAAGERLGLLACSLRLVERPVAEAGAVVGVRNAAPEPSFKRRRVGVGPEAAVPGPVPRRDRDAESGSEADSADSDADSVSSAAGCAGAALCKFWAYRGSCANAMCRFRHALRGAGEEARVARLRASRAASLAVAAREALAYRGDGHSACEVRSKGCRSQVFAAWLLETFGLSLLERGSGVVDVAGGKGGTCVSLLEQSGSQQLRTTVVDPLRRSTPVRAATRARLERLGCQLPRFLALALDAAFEADGERLALLADAAALIGMHPDQATEAIVEAALRLRRPFAVVPCCVFARQFAARRAPGGGLVETLNDLLDYLRNKHPNMQRHVLPFEGRNVVLFMCREHYEEGSSKQDGAGRGGDLPHAPKTLSS
jgi:hypothetical protein